jgi:hypothetical protein
MGFQYTIFQESTKAAEVLPNPCGPDDIRRLLTILSDSAMVIVVFDEFDRIEDDKTKRAMADTIKVLSDNSVPATLAIVGVADSVEGLIAEHQSIERALVQILMPRMSQVELRQIIENGLARLSMTANDEASRAISVLSQGLPHYTHLIGLHACRAALGDRQLLMTTDHVDFAVSKAVGAAQHSIRSAYLKATASNQTDNIYSQVLLACALTKTDPLGCFISGDVREPLSLIAGRTYDIAGYHKHLNQFCEPSRGSILTKRGEQWKYRYRFTNPLLQPYVIMQGLIDKSIDRHTVEEATFFNQTS